MKLKFDKITLEGLAIFLVLILGVVHFQYKWIIHGDDRINSEFLTAKSIAILLPNEDLMAFDADKAPNPLIHEKLKSIISIESRAKSAYLYTLQNNRISIIADSENGDLKNGLPKKKGYLESEAVYKQPFKDGKELNTGLIHDSGERWESILIPLKNESGRTIAVLGMDFGEAMGDYGFINKLAESIVMVLIWLLVLLFLIKVRNRSKLLQIEIFERNRIERELTTSLSMLNATLESTADGILVLNREGKITRYNQSFVDMWQIPVEFLKNGNDEEALHYAVGQMLKPEEFMAQVRALNGKPEKSGTFLIELTDGRLFEKYSHPQRIGEEIIGRVMSFTDITERIRAEEELKTSNSLLNASLESTADGMLVINRSGKIMLYNQKFAEMWDVPKELLTNKDDKQVLEYVVDKIVNADEFVSKIDELYAKPEESSNDTIKLIDGRIFKRYSLPQRIGEEIVGRVWSFRDITKRKRAEKELKTSLSLLNASLESTADGIIVLDREDSIVRYNQKFADMWFIPKDLLANRKEGEVLNHLVGQMIKPDEFLSMIQELGGKPEESSFDTVSLTNGKIYEHYSQPQRIGDKVVGRVWSFRDITERKLAEGALLQSDAKHSSMIVNISDVISVMDAEGLLNYISPNMEKYFGWHPSDLVGTNGFQTIHPDDSERIRQELVKRLEKENSQKTVEYRLLCKDGSFRLIELTAVNLTNDPVIKGVLISFHDITDRKNSENELRESEMRIRALISANPDMMFVIDNDGIFLDYYAGNNVTPYSPPSYFLGKNVAEILPPEVAQLTMKHIKRLQSQGKMQIFKYQLEMNNENIDYECRLVANGITKTLAIISDITIRKQAEEELIKAKEKAEVLLEETQTQKSEIELQNERLEGLLRISQYKPVSKQDLLDYALKEAIDLTSSKIGYIYHYNETTKQLILNTWSSDVMKECTVQDEPTVYDLDKTGCWGEAVRQRKAFIINNFNNENIYRKGTPEGHVQLSNFLTVPIFIDNAIVGVVGVANKVEDYQQSDIRQLTLLMDAVWRISERESMIENLKQAKERAEESDRLKSAFLANMSHEIRTPMNGIMGFAELLKEPDLTGEEQHEYINIIERSGVRMLNIINDIVEISKIESGLMELNIKETNVNEQIEYIYTFFKPEVEAKGMKIFCKNSLPLKEAILRTDREKLYAVLINLVKNAIKYSDKGTIELGYEKKENYLQFFVKDTGIGIPNNRLEAVFNRFVQVDMGDKRAFQGAGLGLSISKAYVEMLGGKIWVESQVGIGTTFYFTLAFNAEMEINNTIANAVLQEEAEHLIKDLKILIAEDDELSAVLLTKAIKIYSKEVLCVGTGVEAVEICRNHPDIDLIMMDIQMPEMDGYKATSHIRQFNKDIIIIAQTAFALSHDQEEAIAAGCNDYISKPFNHALLSSLMKKHFDNQ